MRVLVRRMRHLVAAVGLVVLAVPAGVSAQQSLLFNQSHAYDVRLRANGEAIANVRLTITNPDETDIKSLSYTLDGATADEVAAYQEVSTSECVTSSKDNSTTDTAATRPAASEGSSSSGEASVVDPCVSTSAAPDIYPYYSTSYKKITVAITDGKKLTLTLPDPIKATKTGTIVLAYTTDGYVTKQWDGSLQYAFRTLQSDKRIKDVSVAMSVDSDMYTDNGKGKVSFAGSTDASAASEAMMKGSMDASADMRTYIAGIGSYGWVTKQASNLAANESFLVTGRYADAAWKLKVELWLKIGGGLLVVALLGALWWLTSRRRAKNSTTTKRGTTAASAESSAKVASTQSATGPIGNITSRLHRRAIGAALLAGGAASAAAVSVGLVSVLGVYLASELSGYSGSSFWYLATVVLICSICVLLGIFFLLVIPAWYTFPTRNYRLFMRIIMWEIIALMAITVLALIIGFLVGGVSGSECGDYGCPRPL